MLQLKNISKAFRDETSSSGRNVLAIDQLSLDLPEGKLYCLLGPSGCGKSTTLRAIAGLETPDQGSIVVGDRTFFDSARRIDVPPHRRKLGMVFQSYSIWPHMSVFENVAFPLAGFGIRRDPQIENRVDNVLELVQLRHVRDRPATKLSGGQQQRLALARALVVEPPLLLLDEPLSNLDLKLRVSMRFELKRMQRELNITTLFVTHDQIEALALSDVIAVMNEGRIEQMAPPRELYLSPTNKFVADFVGSISFLRGVVERADTPKQYAVVLPHGMAVVRSAQVLSPGTKVAIGVRPENVELKLHDGEDASGPNVFSGEVEATEYLGGAVDVRVRVGEGSVRARCKPGTRFEAGDAVQVRIPSEGSAIITE